MQTASSKHAHVCRKFGARGAWPRSFTDAQPEVSAPGPTADVIQLMLHANKNGMLNSARPTRAHASDSTMDGSVTKERKLRP